MPNLQETSVVAILCSDIHLSDKPPTFRSNEPDWFEAMAIHLRQLADLARGYDVPIVCAGDVFDRWNSSAALINFALDELPPMYSIPGQHDLPHHQYQDIKSSAYWTLVKAGVIKNLRYRAPVELKGLVLHGFPWASELYCNESTDLALHLGVVHRYLWKDKSTSYVGADQEHHIKSTLKQLKGFDALVFGDNHRGFLIKRKEDRCAVLNCGGFMRRRKDEMDYNPSIGLLHMNGTITRKRLNCAADNYLQDDNIVEAKTTNSASLDLHNFMEELQELGTDSLDYRQAVEQYCQSNKIDEQVYSMIKEAIGND